MKTFFELLENIKSADKKPEIYTKPDGKKGTRMVPVDREVIKQEKTLEWLKSALAREAKATKPRQDDMEEQTEATMYCKDCGCEKGNPDPNCTCPNDNAQLKASQCTTEQSKCKSRKAEAMESVKEDDDEDHRPHTHALVDKKGHAHGFAPYKLRNAHVVKDRNGDTRETSDDHDYAKKRAKRFGGTVVSTKAVKLKKPMQPAQAVKQVGKSIKGHYHEATEAKEEMAEGPFKGVGKMMMKRKLNKQYKKSDLANFDTSGISTKGKTPDEVRQKKSDYYHSHMDKAARAKKAMNRLSRKEGVDELTIADVQKATAMAKKRQEKERKAGKKSVSTADLAARMPKKESFEPHMMYDPKTGKGYKADKEDDHLRMKKMGYTHDKPKNEGVKTFAEISKGMAGRYIKKAQVSTADAAKSTERGYTDSRSPDRDIAKAGSNQAKKGIKTFVNRNKGTSTAVDKLTGKAKVPAK